MTKRLSKKQIAERLVRETSYGAQAHEWFWSTLIERVVKENSRPDLITKARAYGLDVD